MLLYYFIYPYNYSCHISQSARKWQKWAWD